MPRPRCERRRFSRVEGRKKEERKTHLAPRGVREDRLPRLAEDEGDDLEEELGDVNGLRAEVEDLTEDGGELRRGKEGQSKS
jgi:hypothetical protein